MSILSDVMQQTSNAQRPMSKSEWRLPRRSARLGAKSGELKEGSSDRLKYYLHSEFNGAAIPPMICHVPCARSQVWVIRRTTVSNSVGPGPAHTILTRKWLIAMSRVT